MMKRLTKNVGFCFAIIVATFLLSGAIPQKHFLRSRNGDLIFVGAERENLSGAINRVTQTQSDVAFDHIGIVEVAKDGQYVLHASPKKGTIRQPLTNFLEDEQKGQTKFAIYRLRDAYRGAIPAAIQTAKELLGKPYNWTYVLNDSSLYCSDFVERAFRNDSIFELEPMTFIDPQTNKTDEFWLAFYQKLGMDVPEGQLGCNPNKMATTDKIVYIGQLHAR